MHLLRVQEAKWWIGDPSMTFPNNCRQSLTVDCDDPESVDLSFLLTIYLPLLQVKSRFHELSTSKHKRSRSALNIDPSAKMGIATSCCEIYSKLV
jgi:hypothetical protein